MATAHTKGPWFSRFNGHYYDIGLENRQYAHSFASVHVNKSLGIDQAVSEANARLIASAPELVDALQEAREFFDNRADADCDQDGYIPNKEMKLLSVIDEALAKAGVSL